jgi:cell division protein FtsW
MLLKAAHKPDYPFIIAIFLLTVFGVVALSSATAPFAIARFGDAYFYVKRQFLFGVLPGLVLFFFFLHFDYRKLKKFRWWFLAASVLFLILVFIPGLGESFGRTKSWVRIMNFSFQPAEIVKLLFIFFLASWLDNIGEHIKDFRRGLLPFIVFFGFISLLLIMQPDIGTLLIFFVIAFTMVYLAGARVAHLLFLGGIGILGLVGLALMAPYRAARFMTFLHPELDPQGVGYHINQAFLAIGSGGFWGLGFGHSRQKFQYLPEVASDSIFAVLAEELGFIFAFAFIVLLLWIFWRGLKIARRAPDVFSALLVQGIIVWFIFQSFVNVAAMTGLLPLAGVPLPFISHGGTALTMSLAAAGLVAAVSRRRL